MAGMTSDTTGELHDAASEMYDTITVTLAAVLRIPDETTTAVTF